MVAASGRLFTRMAEIGHNLTMHRNTMAKLIRVLGLLGSDQPGERASAALVAHRLVAKAGGTWTELLQPNAIDAPPKVVVRHVREYGVDPESAAEARMRQLKSTNDRLEKEVRALRRRLTGIAERQRRERVRQEAEEELEGGDSPSPSTNSG